MFDGDAAVRRRRRRGDLPCRDAHDFRVAGLLPIFNTPPELARGIAETGWDAWDTASNHSMDQAQTGVDATGKCLDRAGIEHTGSFPSEKARDGSR